jgi:hypothetical protein
MKYGLFAAVALAFVALTGGTASAGGALGGLTKSTVAPQSSIVQEAGYRTRRCYRRCRDHGHSVWRCRKRCGWF